MPKGLPAHPLNPDLDPAPPSSLPIPRDVAPLSDPHDQDLCTVALPPDSRSLAARPRTLALRGFPPSLPPSTVINAIYDTRICCLNKYLSN